MVSSSLKGKLPKFSFVGKPLTKKDHCDRKLRRDIRRESREESEKEIELSHFVCGVCRFTDWIGWHSFGIFGSELTNFSVFNGF